MSVADQPQVAVTRNVNFELDPSQRVVRLEGGASITATVTLASLFFHRGHWTILNSHNSTLRVRAQGVQLNGETGGYVDVRAFEACVVQRTSSTACTVLVHTLPRLPSSQFAQVSAQRVRDDTLGALKIKVADAATGYTRSAQLEFEPADANSFLQFSPANNPDLQALNLKTGQTVFGYFFIRLRNLSAIGAMPQTMLVVGTQPRGTSGNHVRVQILNDGQFKLRLDWTLANSQSGTEDSAGFAAQQDMVLVFQNSLIGPAVDVQLRTPGDSLLAQVTGGMTTAADALRFVYLQSNVTAANSVFLNLCLVNAVWHTSTIALSTALFDAPANRAAAEDQWLLAPEPLRANATLRSEDSLLRCARALTLTVPNLDAELGREWLVANDSDEVVSIAASGVTLTGALTLPARRAARIVKLAATLYAVYGGGLTEAARDAAPAGFRLPRSEGFVPALEDTIGAVT